MGVGQTGRKLLCRLDLICGGDCVVRSCLPPVPITVSPQLPEEPCQGRKAHEPQRASSQTKGSGVLGGGNWLVSAGPTASLVKLTYYKKVTARTRFFLLPPLSPLSLCTSSVSYCLFSAAQERNGLRKSRPHMRGHQHPSGTFPLANSWFSSVGKPAVPCL